MSTELIKELRARTHFGLTDCKVALEQASGNIDQAIEILKKKGLKKADTMILSTEGEVFATVGDKFGGVVVEVNCQTDFAARSDQFKSFVRTTAAKLATDGMKDLDSIVEDGIQLSKVLGESVHFRRRQFVLNKGYGMVRAYNHPGGRIAVLVSLEISPNDFLAAMPDSIAKLNDLAEHIAMHVAAVGPKYVDRSEVRNSVVESKISEISNDPAFAGKKPEQVAKIAEGKMNKWYGETVLLEQESVVEPKQTIKAVIEKVEKQYSCSIKVGNFVRYERGEQD